MHKISDETRADIAWAIKLNRQNIISFDWDGDTLVLNTSNGVMRIENPSPNMFTIFPFPNDALRFMEG